MTLGWGIIGLGRSADTLIAPGIAADPNSRLVAVVSRDQSRGDAFAARHGASRAGTDYAAMLSNPDIDVVAITTPNAFHAEQVVAAARAGKNVLCDKPMATSTAEAKDAFDACRQAGVKLGINFQTRHFTCFQEARRVIASGEIGDVIAVQIDAASGDVPLSGWRADPRLARLGSINNIAVHIYDVLRFLLAAEVTEVTALLDNVRGLDLERLPMVLMRFSNGALVYANGNQRTPLPLNDVVIHGTEGRIDGRGITRPQTEGKMSVVSKDGERSKHYSSYDCYDRTIRAFSEAVLAGRDPDPSGLDGLRCVQITDAIQLSAREGRHVGLEYD
jgi:1,5-anhydro-D-fructose reductase (1,5-anhydro-D-mannitol-forming)